MKERTLRFPTWALCLLGLDWLLVWGPWGGEAGLALRVGAALGLAGLLRVAAGIPSGLSYGRPRASLRTFGVAMGVCTLASVLLLAALVASLRAGLLHAQLATANVHRVEDFWGWCLHAVVWYPLGEELIYRGLIQEHLRRALGSRWSILGSGVVFWVLHWIYFGRVTFPNHLVGGWVIAWSHDRTRSLLAPTLLHSVGNLVLGLGDLLVLTRPEFMRWLVGGG